MAGDDDARAATTNDGRQRYRRLTTEKDATEADEHTHSQGTHRSRGRRKDGRFTYRRTAEVAETNVHRAGEKDVHGQPHTAEVVVVVEVVVENKIVFQTRRKAVNVGFLSM
jgi:hypothetical protein